MPERYRSFVFRNFSNLGRTHSSTLIRQTGKNKNYISRAASSTATNTGRRKPANKLGSAATIKWFWWKDDYDKSSVITEPHNSW